MFSKVLYLFFLLGLIVNISCKKTEKPIHNQSGNNTNKTILKVDYLIKGGLLYDGTLNEAKQLDIAINADTIAFIGNSDEYVFDVQKVIVASDYLLTPGFIDPHTHTDGNFNSTNSLTRANLAYLRQGVTTVLTGNDGYGPVEIKQQLAKWKNSGIGTNAGLFVGFGELRKTVLGNDNVQPNGLQLASMKGLVEQAMREGAFGLSTGLSYLPQSYSLRSGNEIKELAKSIFPYGGIYDTHMRNQSSGTIDAMNEVREISQYAGGLKVHISHIKVTPQSNFNKVDEMINLMNKSRAEGMDMTANVYPYMASSDGLSSMLSATYRSTKEVFNTKYNDPVEKNKMINSLNSSFISIGGSVEEGAKLKLVVDATAAWKGKTIYEIAQSQGKAPANTVLDMLYSKLSIGVITFTQSEEVMKKFLALPYVVTGSDGVNTHPRSAGTFPEAIKKYSVDQGVQSLTQAIHTSSGLTAEIFGIKKRGILKVGNYADILVLDINNYKAHATYLEPNLYATGLKYVFLNGKIVIENDNYKNVLAGVPILKNE